MRFFISAQTLACNTFRGASTVVDSGDGASVNTLWPDRVWIAVPAAVWPGSAFFAAEDEPDNGVPVGMARLVAAAEPSGFNLVRGVAASGSVANGVGSC